MPQQQWLTWVKKLQAISQIGLTYTEGIYDRERYEQIRDVASEIASQHVGIDAGKISNLYKEEKGYATPKVDVRGVVFNEKGELLLVKEGSTGKWTLPGGWADVWDTPAQAAVREIREESGYETKATKLLAVYDRENQGHPSYAFSIYKLHFCCEILGGEAKPNHETLDVGFFAENDLPPLDEYRTLEKHALRCFVHYRQPDLPTDFD